jgi:hypothetical protein
MTPYNLELHKVDQDWDEVTPCSLEEWKIERSEENWQEQVTGQGA